MSYLSVETSEQYQINWVVSSDQETSAILNSNPQELIDEIFLLDSDNDFLLKRTGFSMAMQIQTWINLHNKAITENGDLDNVTELLISKTIQDILGFYFEYLTRQDVFPIHVEFIENENGEKTVYASKYNQTLESVTLPNERDGALAEGVKKAVSILTKSEPETIVFLVSPEGESGLGHDHPDNQTYVYWINSEGNLEALTIRSDIDLLSSEKLIDLKKQDHLTTWERLKEVVRSPKKIHASSFDEILTLMEEASGQSFEKQRQQIKNRDKLFTLNENATLIVKNLKDYLSGNISHLNRDSIKIFVKAVGKAILDLAHEVLPQKQSRHIYINTGYQHEPPDYHSLYQRVQEIDGCNGGGTDGSSYVDARLAMGLFSFVDGGAKFVYNCGSCGASVNAVISAGYQCSSCGGIYLGC